MLGNQPAGLGLAALKTSHPDDAKAEILTAPDDIVERGEFQHPPDCGPGHGAQAMQVGISTAFAGRTSGGLADSAKEYRVACLQPAPNKGPGRCPTIKDILNNNQNGGTRCGHFFLPFSCWLGQEVRPSPRICHRITPWRPRN